MDKIYVNRKFMPILEAVTFLQDDNQHLMDALDSIGRGWNKDACLLAEEARVARRKGGK